MDECDELNDYDYTGDDHGDDYCQRHNDVDDDDEHNHDDGRKVLGNIMGINSTSDFSSSNAFASQPLVNLWS